MTVTSDITNHIKSVTAVTFWTTGNIIWVAALACCVLSCCGFCCYIFAPPKSKGSITQPLLPCEPGQCIKVAGEITVVESRFGSNQF